MPNEHGTWYFGRNGWCDGQDVAPLVWDITADVDLKTPGAVNSLRYFALAYVGGDGAAGNGSDAGCQGNIQQSTYLIYYSAVGEARGRLSTVAVVAISSATTIIISFGLVSVGLVVWACGKQRRAGYSLIGGPEQVRTAFD